MPPPPPVAHRMHATYRFGRAAIITRVLNTSRHLPDLHNLAGANHHQPLLGANEVATHQAVRGRAQEPWQVHWALPGEGDALRRSVPRACTPAASQRRLQEG
eukprot:4202219-Pleurochrysis_carterae.AAC.1